MELPASTEDITVKWLNEVLHGIGFLDIINIVSLKHEQIGVGEGFTSDIARIQVSYDKDSNNLPLSFIAKLPTSYEPVRQGSIVQKFYEREIHFYQEIAPSSPIRIPKHIYSAMDIPAEKYVLIIEDCSKYVPADPDLEGMNKEEAESIVLTIAEFHARWWNDASLDSFRWLPKSHELYTDFLVNMYHNYWDAGSQLDEFKQALPEGGLEAGRLLNQKLLNLVDMAPRERLTIMHSDFKADNVYFDLEAGDMSVIIFDWATARTGRGVSDVSRLLGTSVTVETRREIEHDMINKYHRRLMECGVTDYTYEECWDDYLMAYLPNSIFPLAMFAAADRSSERADNHALQNVNRWYSAIVDNDAISLLP